MLEKLILLKWRKEFQAFAEVASWRCGGVASLSWPDLHKGPASIGGNILIKLSSLFLVSPFCHLVIAAEFSVVMSARQWVGSTPILATWRNGCAHQNESFTISALPNSLLVKCVRFWGLTGFDSFMIIYFFEVWMSWQVITLVLFCCE